MGEPTCSIDGCESPVAIKSRGWCQKHYSRWRQHGDPEAPVQPYARRGASCSVTDCGEPMRARGWCVKHYWRWQQYGDPERLANTDMSCLGCGGPIAAHNKHGFCWQNPECAREYGARWHCANRERQAELSRQRDSLNPGARRARGRRWRKANPQKSREAMARWRETHPREWREAYTRWRSANPQRVRSVRAAWLARTDRPCKRLGCADFAAKGRYYCLDHDSESSARRHARRASALALRLYVQQNGLCPGEEHGGCGEPLGQSSGNHADHLIPLAANGPDEDWNLQLMHPECNLRKGIRLTPAALRLAAERGVNVYRTYYRAVSAS